jgi:hypothetical protein
MKLCAVPRCGRPKSGQSSWARNPFCKFHGTRLRGTGDLVLQARPGAWDRFVDRVLVTADDCWHWLGSGTGRGHAYGQFWYHGSNGLAHRFAYETMVGPIPRGLELDHICRVQRCVNPAHLEAVTPSVNMQRMHDAKKGATK